MGRSKYVINTFLLYEKYAMEKYFEKMSEKGWMADYFGAFTIRFRACEPKKRKFQIAYSEDGDILGQGLYKGAKELDEMIDESTDYRFIFKRKRRLVYVSENPDTVDIDTDKESALKCIDGVVNEYGMAGWILTLFAILPTVFLLNVMGEFTKWSVWDMLMDMVRQPMALILAALSGYGLLNIVLYKVWFRRSKVKIAVSNRLAETKSAHYIVLIYCIITAALSVAVMIVYLMRGDSFAVYSVITAFTRVGTVAFVYAWYEYWKKHTKGNGGLLIGVSILIIVGLSVIETIVRIAVLGY